MEDKKKFIINILFYAIVLVLVYAFFKVIFPMIVPFVIAAFLAYLGVKFSEKVFKDNSKLHKTISLIIVYFVLVFLIVVLGSLVTNKLLEFFQDFPNLYNNFINPTINKIIHDLDKLNSSLPDEYEIILSNGIDNTIDSIESIVMSVSTYLVAVLTKIVTGAPDLLIDITICVISSFYFIYDYQSIIAYCKNLIPDSVVEILSKIREFCESNLFNIVKSYVVIMSITFVELLIGLSIFGINNAPIVAFVTCFVDIFPIVGVGTVLLPWAAISLITGNYILGIELAILYTIITVVRNFIEPRLVGGHLGLHPLAALVSMIIGLDLIGVFGMFIFPLILSFIVTNYIESN